MRAKKIENLRTGMVICNKANAKCAEVRCMHQAPHEKQRDMEGDCTTIEVEDCANHTAEGIKICIPV